MTALGTPVAEGEEPVRGPVRPSGLLDVLGVASVVLDTEGRIVLWSPQAEELFGYPAHEALGQYAARIMVHEQHLDLVVKLFSDVMATGEGWAGAFPVRRKDGSTRLVEFRNMRLMDDRGDVYALGLCADQSTVRLLERDVALSSRMVAQSPIGLAVLDTGLRYVSVNPALARINGLPAEKHLGRTIREVLPLIDIGPLEAAAREVLQTGRPLVDQQIVGRAQSDPDEDHAWTISLYRLEDALGTVLGVAASVVDVTEQYRAGVEAEAARRRLALIADASARIGTTLELDRTARELADVAVPELADVDLPTGAPLGVGGVAFTTTTVDLEPGDRLVFYTDGLVETRRHLLDERLDTLLALLDGPDRPLDEVCDLLLQALREPDNSDDVALLIARARPMP
ncbi:PAS domain-containing protein [Streptomyces sp. TRM68367]|uniref:PAS domain-containing protein n=1 Tax=Streptomyces sp. TRM68367 TaxID=2758415 RepID=UPI00165C07E8|nr:PAS domain-containing protein [Streptomyces sp. TRM68367]MBC9727774.1 PAS domain-containing protein [Streptomyces sp. TRM68367]